MVGIESASTIGMGATLGYLLFFVLLYVQIITTFIRFFLTAGLSYLLMPFAGFDKTKDITNKALNGLFSSAIEVYVLIVVLNFTEQLQNHKWFTPLTELGRGMDNIKETLITRWVLLIFMYMLINKVGAISSAMLSGAIASLGIGQAAQSAALGKMQGAAGVFNNDLNSQSRDRGKNLRDENNSSMSYKMAADAGRKASKFGNDMKMGAKVAWSNFKDKFR